MYGKEGHLWRGNTPKAREDTECEGGTPKVRKNTQGEVGYRVKEET